MARVSSRRVGVLVIALLAKCALQSLQLDMNNWAAVQVQCSDGTWLEPSNSERYGTWSARSGFCSTNMVARGLAVKMESKQGAGDDTGEAPAQTLCFRLCAALVQPLLTRCHSHLALAHRVLLTVVLARA